VRGGPARGRTRGALWLLPALVLLLGEARADRRADLEALRAAIHESRERVADFESRSRGMLEAVEALDRAALLLTREVEEARREAVAARDELSRLEVESADLRSRLQRTQRLLSARAVALYRTGELGAVRVLFSSDGLPQFLSRVSALRRLLRNDAALLERFQSESLALARAEERAQHSAERLATAESELASRSAELEVERSRKKRLLSTLREDRTRERSALEELEQAARALEETLESLGAEPAPSEGAIPGPPFITKRFQLAPPVDGLVVQGYGRQVEARYLTETFQAGLTYEAPLGTPVYAVAAGQVRFAGWFRGYGRMVILDHGDDYFSVSSHLGEVRVAVGDVLRAGRVIGTVGETGSLAGPRLHFEIRRGAEPLDPADWLRAHAAR